MKGSKGLSPQKGGTTVRIAVVLGVLALAAAILVVARFNTVAENDHKASISAERAEAVDKTETIKTLAPEFALKDLSGGEVKLSDYRGKVVVVNFWATWCGPCRAEIPAFVSLREQYHDQGFEIIGISLDRDGQEAVATFANRLKINYPIVIGNLETVEIYGPMNAIPTTFIVDRQGQVRSRHLGMLTFDEIESEIKPLL